MVLEKIGYPRLKFPTELEFEPIQLCNALCFHCPYTFLQESKEYRGKKMSREYIKMLLEQFGDLLLKNKYKGNAFVNPFRYSDPLICKDLDLIFEIAKNKNFNVRITTNGVSFNEANSELLNKNLSNIDNNINISVIGSTAEKIKKYMNVNLDITFKRLEKVSKNFPEVSRLIRVGLSEVECNDQEESEFKELEKMFSNIGIKSYRKKNWRHNRIYGDRKKQKENDYIIECSLFKNKLLRRMEVMVNGDVVLCDDDADGRKIFGNVFEEGIEKIWNGKLFEEHKLIYNKNFSEEKNKMICNSCTRAVWNKRKSNFYSGLSTIGKKEFVKQVINNNVKWI